MKDNKQLPQFIILGVLVALFAGYIVVKLTGSKPKVAQEVPKEPTQSQVVDQKGSPSAGEIDPATQVVVEIPTNAGLRDPFKPTMIMAINNTPQVSEAPKRIATSDFRANAELPPYIPSLGTNTQSGNIYDDTENQQTAQSNGQQSNAEPEPMPEYMVTGIITGATNVAVIRLGDNRYIVKKGQFLDGTYEVVSVMQSGVLLKRDGHTVLLKLGGEGDAS